MDLIGKKVLIIHDVEMKNQNNNKVGTGVIVGCDPEIGICVAFPGMEKNPWCVLNGPSSPDFKYSILTQEQSLKLNNFVLNQLKSGYISVPAIYTFMKNISRKSLNRFKITCPYSM